LNIEVESKFSSLNRETESLCDSATVLRINFVEVLDHSFLNL
jgi:hypothetical protein